MRVGTINKRSDASVRLITVSFSGGRATVLLGDGVRENTPLRRSICGVQIPTAKVHSMSALWR